MACKLSTKVYFGIRGPFSAADQNGQSVAPRGRKSQGILALLIMSRNLSRTRGFLKDMLWSDRGPEQAAASLRFGLTEIRKAFGDRRDIIGADRHSVWLNPDLCEIDNSANSNGLIEDLFEGLDIRDPEFSIWLSSLRANDPVALDQNMSSDEFPSPPISSTKITPALQNIVVFHGQAGSGGKLGVIEDVVAEFASQTLREQTASEVFVHEVPHTSRSGLFVSLQAFENIVTRTEAHRYGLRISIEALVDGRILWSDMAFVGGQSDVFDRIGYLHHIAARLANAVMQHQNTVSVDNSLVDSNLKALIGVQKMFVIRPKESSQAEQLLLEAFEARPRGVYLAWLAQLHVIQFVECLCSRQEVLEKALERSAKALELEPENSHVLAANANTRLVFERDTELARYLSKLAIKSNPCNPMAWCILGQVQLYSGEVGDALVSSTNAQKLAAGSALQFWMDFQKALACAMTGRLSEATILTRMSTSLRPDFHAALRYSIAFHCVTDQQDHARSAARKLSLIEPGFSTQRMAEDSEYPIGLMRTSSLFVPDQFRRLEI